MLSTTTPAFAVTTPPTARVEAISTAPSISTTSKLDVPSTSISPDMSSAVPIRVCEKVTCPLEAIVIASTSEADPIVLPSPIIKSSVSVTIPVTPNVPPIVMSSVTVRSSEIVKSSTVVVPPRFRLVKASTIAAPEPAPSEYTAFT